MKPPRSPAALAALARGDIENARIASTPGGIERQEAEGQNAVVGAGNLLPIRTGRFVRDPSSKDHKIVAERQDPAILEQLGFVVGEDYDDQFMEVVLPPGWSWKKTESSYWSRLIDEKGRERGSMFYKAAFYDRSAHFQFTPRFILSSYEAVDPNVRGRGPSKVQVLDCGKPVLNVGVWEQYEEREKLEQQAREWLQQNYPDYENPHAYWD